MNGKYRIHPFARDKVENAQSLAPEVAALPGIDHRLSLLGVEASADQRSGNRTLDLGHALVELQRWREATVRGEILAFHARQVIQSGKLDPLLLHANRK